MMPLRTDALGVETVATLEEMLPRVDVLMMLRLQLERQEQALIPSAREYSVLFGLNAERLRLAKKGLLVMHPGPINRGVEITPDVADADCSLILDQVANGVAVRMALLFLIASASTSRGGGRRSWRSTDGEGLDREVVNSRAKGTSDG